MSAREFYGESLKTCLEQVKAALGSDAMILETKKVRQGGGLLGMQGREVVCVVATTEEEYASASEPEETDKDILAIRETLTRLRASANQAKQNPVPPARPSASPISSVPPSSLAAARNAYKTQAAPTTRLDQPRSIASKPLFSKATFPAIERPAQNEGTRLPPVAAPQQSSPAIATRAVVSAPQTTVRKKETFVNAPTKGYTPPPAIRNLTPLTRPSAPPQNQGESRDSAERPSATQTLNEQGNGSAESGGRMGKNLQELRQNLQQLRSRFTDYEKNLTAVVSKGDALATVARPSSVAGAFPELRTRLRVQGVSQRLVEDLIREIPDLSAWGEMAQAVQAEVVVRDLIAERFACAGAIQLIPNQLKKVALIGTTGVGKTTTIAKLAARYALLERKRVALLTIDAYRIAAVEQLKTYSQIIDIPIYVAQETEEIAGILEACRDFDLLLVDTAGRSQLNARQVMELKPFLEALQCETHLVLSASTKEEDLLETARRFTATRVDRLIFTKLDETNSYGSLLNVADKTGIPLTYLTTGQRVPEDIEVAKGSAIAELILP